MEWTYKDGLLSVKAEDRADADEFISILRKSEAQWDAGELRILFDASNVVFDLPLEAQRAVSEELARIQQGRKIRPVFVLADGAISSAHRNLAILDHVYRLPTRIFYDVESATNWLAVDSAAN